MFAPLCVISGYSFLESGLTIEKIKNSVEKNSYFGVGLADMNVMFGVPEFISTMEKAKKNFIIGMSFVVNGQNVVAYVLNEEGYKNLCLINQNISENKLTEDFLLNNHSGLLGILETNHGKFKELFNNNDSSLPRFVNSISKLFDEFYLGIEATNKNEFSVAKEIRKFAANHTYETVAFPRIKYQEKSDAIILDLVNAIKENTKLEYKTKDGQEYFMKEADYQKIYTKKEMDLTTEIIKKSQFNFHAKRGEILHFPVENSEKYLHEQIESGLKSKQLESENYIQRAEKEYQIITKMGYADYFLIVQDYVKYAKSENIIVGSGRGSAAGSLVSYLLDISEVDPLKFDLQFERFLNEGRNTMPDIDIDFMDIKRDDMVQYMRDKYGTNRVANIATIQTILAKQSLRDIGRIYDIPTRHIDLLCKTLTNKNYDLRTSYKKLAAFKNLVDSDKYFLDIVSLASKIENLPRQSGLHAAGIILNNSPLSTAIPISRDIFDNYVASYEKDYLEDQGFLKMDFLGLRNLSIIDYTLNLINKRNENLNLSYENIPYDDPKAFEIISQGLTMGIFQLESTGMKRAIKIIKPKEFDDIVNILALFRPGPMDNIKSFARRKEGKEKIPSISKGVDEVLKNTYGIIVFQEQVNQIALVMAGFTLSEADLFRRAISKKKKEEIEQLKNKFINGCINNGYCKYDAEKTFNLLEKFADYGFNKSHSVGYSYIASRMAYLKAHYPLEFYASILEYSGTANDNKFSEYASEMKQQGIKLLPPNINKSSNNFSLYDDGIIFPLSAIKGVNRQIVEFIVFERNKGDFTDFFDFVIRMHPYKISEKNISQLINAGALDCLYHSRSSMHLTTKASLQFAEVCYGEDGQLALDNSLMPKPKMLTDVDDPIEILDKEYEALGIMISDNPLKYKRDLLIANNVIPLATSHEFVDTITIAGIIKSKKIINTKKGTAMCFIKLCDETSEIEVTIFPDVYSNRINVLEKNNIVLVTGKYQVKNDEESFIADEIKYLEE